jgi:hypothetical protein
MATSSRAIYRKILDVLRDALADRVSPSCVYISADPVFDRRDKIVVQIIPGSPAARSPRSSHPLLDEDFDVAVWYQSMLDESVSGTERLTSETESAFQIVEEIRLALQGSTLEDLATIEVGFVRGSRPSRSSENPFWVQTTDTFRVAYELARR